MGDERRQWRRFLGKGIPSVFRVNREFAALAAPHFFKVSALLRRSRPELTLTLADVLHECNLQHATRRSWTSTAISHSAFQGGRFANGNTVPRLLLAQLSRCRYRHSTSERTSPATGLSIHRKLRSPTWTTFDERSVRDGQGGRYYGRSRLTGSARHASPPLSEDWREWTRIRGGER